MSAFRRGDWVFVYPEEPDAPREVRGLAGTIKRIRGDRATVVWRHDENAFAFDVEAHLLNHERRRRNRAPAQWSSHDLATAG